MSFPIRSLFVVISMCCFFSAAQAKGYVFKNGRVYDASEIACFSVEEHYALGGAAIEAEDWIEAVHQFRIITSSFPSTDYAQESYYYLGAAYFFLDEYDLANIAFSQYLECQTNPRYFQEVIDYKFCIAEKFASGSKRRFLGTKKLPKWACGKEIALIIFDEVIAAVPCHDIAAYALVSKGCLLWNMHDFRPAIEAFQLVIRRFPKHELTPECYLLISQVYVDLSRREFQNPDILAFAEINLGRFEKDFPREPRITNVEADVMTIKEIYAQGFYETGQFYERIYKPRAAIIYYYNVLHQFPDTCVSDCCRNRLACLDPTYCDPYAEEENTESCTSNDDEIIVEVDDE